MVSIALALIAMSCNNNEPYELGTLLLTKLTNKSANVSHAYQYKDLRLYLHKTMVATTSEVSHWSKFHYAGDELSLIISDSTAETNLQTVITWEQGHIVKDSSTRFTYNDTTGVARRLFTYNSDGRLASITSDQFTDGTILSRRYDYSWTGNNVTTVSQSIWSANAWVPEITLTLEYDNGKSAFGENEVYMYTLPELEYYRLSANNHVRVISSTSGAINFTYSYNRFRLPAKYTSTTGIEYSFVYSEQE